MDYLRCALPPKKKNNNNNASNIVYLFSTQQHGNAGILALFVQYRAIMFLRSYRMRIRNTAPVKQTRTTSSLMGPTEWPPTSLSAW